MPEVLFVKNMVCHRCQLAVETILKNIEISDAMIKIGEIHLNLPISTDQNRLLDKNLQSIGLALIDNRSSGLIDRIKRCRIIENYLIEQRIEKVKELIVYEEMSLSAIHYLLEYSSVAHLSNQFKKVTGLTPSHFKKVGSVKRKMLDKV